MKDNPIYLHLTRDFHQPTSRIERLLLFAVGILGTSAAGGAVYYEWTFVSIVIVLVLSISSLGFVVMASSLALIVAALFTAKDAHEESLAVLRLTNITSRQIVDGYIGAVAYRLRILQVIGIGLVPQTIVILASYLSSPFYSSLLSVCIPAIFITGMLTAMTILLCSLAIIAGVWVGFRWRGKALGVAGGILLVAWIVFISSLFGLYFGLEMEAGHAINISYVTYMMKSNLLLGVGRVTAAGVVAGVVAAILWSLAQVTRSGACRTVERMRQMQ